MVISKKKAMLATTGAVLALGLAVPAVAFAQESTPTPPASASPDTPSSVPGRPGKGTDTDREQQRAEHQKAFAQALAKELGIDQAKVETALEKVRSGMESDAKAQRLERLKARLDQAVKDGKLTQEQADAVLKASESGALPGGFGGRGGHGGPGFMGGGPR